ncbi:pre-rRNA-processing protein pno1 [Physocladia obscura]|uniref:Pre-rRNA-processing protein PNO1 n=1 Tax=Physocladia obscura TaxID=109957 RepID=A0AAD5XDG6_9FUNG|nr:pre-rRNA-processing protein pno1 [Physocladia obscura]
MTTQTAASPSVFSKAPAAAEVGMLDDSTTLDQSTEQEVLDTVMGSTEETLVKPQFDVLRRVATNGNNNKEFRSVPIPPHRMTPLKKEWLKIYSPLVEHLKLQVRMNIKRKSVELRTCKETIDTGALQKGADFVRAFSLGFEIADAMALIRLDDLFMETFETKDVRTLHGDNLSRAIGRIVGKDGRTRHAIENASRTRLVVADRKIHILGGFANIRIARDAVCSLILGASPGKVYTKLRTIASRQKERF